MRLYLKSLPIRLILKFLLYNEGDTANVGDVVARLETDAANAQVKTNGASKKAETKKEEPKKEEVKQEELIPVAETAPKEEKSGAGSGFYSPLVLNIAQKEGVSMNELSAISGTGIGGRVRKQDILSYVEQRKTSGPVVKQAEIKTETKTAPVQVAEKKQPEYKPAEIQHSPELTHLYNMPGVKVVPMDNLQAKMSEHMVMSVRTSPHVTAIAECDMSNVDKARKAMGEEFQKREGFKLSYMPFICEATIKTLQDFPLVNSSIDGTNILVKNFINLGIAVAMDKGGLIVPVIKNADSKNLVGIARDLNDLAKRARVKKLTLDEIQDGTFTITNYGVFGNDIGTPIINQPQICIMGTGAIKKRPVVVETEQGDAIVIKPMMYITLAFDHRLIDGALGGKFLMRVIQYLENYKG
jgi:2-oxoglutarate dehydrogenase E2 component (dihydrolipoamide succinyltransferase)